MNYFILKVLGYAIGNSYRDAQKTICAWLWKRVVGFFFQRQTMVRRRTPSYSSVKAAAADEGFQVQLETVTSSFISV